MRFLSISLILLGMGCTTYPKKSGYVKEEYPHPKFINPYFSDSHKDYVYKANIAAFDQKFGGILVIKMLGQNHHRIAFTTELGNTIFDFSIEGERFQVNRILKELDRRLLLNILEWDFKTLVKETIIPLQVFQKQGSSLVRTNVASKSHFYNFTKDTLKSIVRLGHTKERVVTEFSKISDHMARHIHISHKNIKLTISLQAIK